MSDKGRVFEEVREQCEAVTS